MNTPEPKKTGDSGRSPVVLIAGPTASGKSALALELAEQCDGVVINADASQVYYDLETLSARPPLLDRMRASHRLFGHIDGAEACSAARWASDSKAEIAAAHAAGHLPILVGGTGLYIRTLLDGIAPIPDIDPDIRLEVRALPVTQAYEALSKEDPASAARLAPADTTRIARALEVMRSTGRTIIEWRTHKEGGIASQIDLHPIILLPPRDWLTARCDRRFETMLEDGAIAEVEALLARALPPELPVMRAIGVPEVTAFLSGEILREEMVTRGQTATRQYAKRQYTWFSRQPPPNWTRLGHAIDNKDDLRIAIKLLNTMLT